jgi:hypothetical protein
MSGESKKSIVLINRVSDSGEPCPDGVDCPAQWQTNWGRRITVGTPVTDTEVLAMLHLAPGEVAVETPEALHEAP